MNGTERFLNPLILSLALLVSGCGTTSAGSTGTGNSGLTGLNNNNANNNNNNVLPVAQRAYLGTQSPGDVWSWNFDPNTSMFSAQNQTKGLNYSGTFMNLNTGFLQMTVTSTNDPNAPSGQKVTAVEMPGTALLVMPPGRMPNSPGSPGMAVRMMVAISLGENPTASANYNVCYLPGTGWDVSKDASSGVVATTVSGTGVDMLVSGTAMSGTVSSMSATAATMNAGGMGMGMAVTPAGGLNFTGCTAAAGQISRIGNAARFAMTPSGAMIGDMGPSPGHIAGFAGLMAPTANVDMAAVQAGSYRGFSWNDQEPNTVPIGCSNVAGVFTGSPFSNDGTAPIAGHSVNFSMESQPSPGMIRFSLMDPVLNQATDHYVAAVAQIKGKFMIFGTGVTTAARGGAANIGESFMLIQQ